MEEYSREELGDEYDVLNVLTLKGLESRTIKRKMSTVKTAHVKAVKFKHLGIRNIDPNQTKLGYILVQMLPQKTCKQTDAQVCQEYDQFIAAHRPVDANTPGKRCWIRIDASVTKLDRDDFDDSDPSVFPREYKIYNAHALKSLAGKYKRAKAKGVETCGLKTVDDVPIQHGYQLMQLTVRGHKPRKNSVKN